MAKDGKRAQKAAQKRKLREQRVREEKARRRTAQEGGGVRRTLTRARDLPVEECVISRGWRERGLAHILLARRRDDGSLVVGGYYVDTLCLGLKDTAVIPNVSPDDYRQNVKPNVFNDAVEFEDCEPGLARAVVEGAIAFAAGTGFRPNKRWEESKHLFDGVEARAEGLTFGREGMPCLVLRGGEQNPVAVARLERALGAGNFAVVVEAGAGDASAAD